jgi:cardiolipin synthase
MITWPTFLTITRMVLTPLIVTYIGYEQWTMACVLFIIAAITDVFDGLLARHYGQETQLGAYLDPLADKLLITSCYGSLLYNYGASVGIPKWLIIIVIIREVLLIGGVCVLSIRSLQVSSPISIMIRPTWLGKGTTVVHCFILSMIFIIKIGIFSVGFCYVYAMCVLAAILMVISGVQYAIVWRQIMDKI